MALSIFCSVVGVIALGYLVICAFCNVAVLVERLRGFGSFSGIYLIGTIAGLVAYGCALGLGRRIDLLVGLGPLPDMVLVIAETWFWIRLHVLKLPDKSSPSGGGG